MFPVDILLLVMRSEEIVWHLGLHPILNTTCDFVWVLQIACRIIKFHVLFSLSSVIILIHPRVGPIIFTIVVLLQSNLTFLMFDSLVYLIKTQPLEIK